ncbi:hypothetical protein AMAG_05713 [Allomyces macrogynus ATCC 38327]|uniref:F-box domain-containing protein n=1 Tax=Allomyces macrogynus (strain ATCC 38327) TaxID=578462 RepID=A0A0L0SCZ8_ALLM3|nr:hypothetical protein AMAG_05713 [Allomyces macrogynus ATCC 38327]|eukprot:KNE60312.1 hypothetical protein AMAG_05713 [Allomyces macrogynus ATCC 38327]
MGGMIFVPPQCQQLAVAFIQSWDMIMLPPTLVQLELTSLVMHPSLLDVFSAWTPHALRKIVLCDVIDFDGGALVAALIERMPLTVMSFDVSCAMVDEVPEQQQLALANLICRLPSLNRLGLGVGYGIAGLDAVMRALPRIGFPSLYLNLRSSPDDAAKDSEIVARLVASFPTTVSSLAFDGKGLNTEHALALVASLPRATDKLDVFIHDWTTDMFRELPLLSTLRELRVTFRNVESDDLQLLFARLPKTLESLDIGTWLCNPADIRVHTLALNMPPQLTSFRIARCGLDDSDLDLLDRAWPDTLRYLDLSDNWCFRGPMGLPDGLQKLNLKSNPLRDQVARTWVVALPTSLRMLELEAEAMGANMVSALLERIPVQNSSWRRMKICSTFGFGKCPFREQLVPRFNLM